MEEKRKQFLDIETTPGKKYCEDCWHENKRFRILQQWGLSGLTPILKEVLRWVEYYQTVSHTTEKSFMKGRICWYANFMVVLF